MDQNGQFSEPNEWQAQAFVSQFANSNNANQEDFVASPFAAFPMLPLGGFPFPQLPYNAGSNGDTFMTGDFQPEVGLYNNDGVFMQNQLVNAQVRFVEDDLVPFPLVRARIGYTHWFCEHLPCSI